MFWHCQCKDLDESFQNPYSDLKKLHSASSYGRFIARKEFWPQCKVLCFGVLFCSVSLVMKPKQCQPNKRHANDALMRPSASLTGLRTRTRRPANDALLRPSASLTGLRTRTRRPANDALLRPSASLTGLRALASRRRPANDAAIGYAAMRASARTQEHATTGTLRRRLREKDENVENGSSWKYQKLQKGKT